MFNMFVNRLSDVFHTRPMVGVGIVAVVGVLTIILIAVLFSLVMNLFDYIGGLFQ